MAKGKITGTNTQPTGSSSVSTTITAPDGTTATGATPRRQSISGRPPVELMTGTIQDAQTNKVYSFQQQYGIELGLVDQAKVKYFTVDVTINGQVQTIANSVQLLNKGEIWTISPDNRSGTLIHKATGDEIPFSHLYASESGLVPATQTTKGTMVHFETIVDSITGDSIAVALEII